MAIDTERLIRDLRAGAAASLEGDAAIAPVSWGMARGWLVLAAAIEDGEYDFIPKGTIADLDPAWDAPENVIPGQYDSDDLDRIVIEKDRKETQ